MKILFISHDSSYTGAPIVFLHLITELKLKYTVGGGILTLKNGPLDDKFKNILELITEKKQSFFKKKKYPYSKNCRNNKAKRKTIVKI